MITRKNHGRGHSYYLDGAKLPGVTTVLSNGVPKPALLNWAANVTAEFAVDHFDELADMAPSLRLKKIKDARFADRDAAAHRGTQVHQIAEQLVAGKQVDVPDEIAGHVESYVQFLNDFDPQPVLVEAVVVSRQYLWAGTLDLVADFPTLNDRRLLCDVKTSRSGVFGETAWQLAGYRYADQYLHPDGTERDMIPVDGCAVIHIRADGYSFVPMQVGPEQLRELRYIQEVAAAVERSREYVGEEITPGKAIAS